MGDCKVGTWRSGKSFISASSIRALPVWFPLLGWALAALLFSFYYMGLRTSFCGITAAFPHTIRSSSFLSPADQVDHRNNFELPIKLERRNNISPELSRVDGNLSHPRPVVEYVNSSMKDQEKTKDDYELQADLTHCQFPADIQEFHLLHCGASAGRKHQLKIQDLKGDTRARVAFMFLSRGELPHEPLWRRFFDGHEGLYSIYVHTHPAFVFTNDSFFYGHQVPSESVDRYSINVVDAVRRYALNKDNSSITNVEYDCTVVSLQSMGVVHVSYFANYDRVIDL